MTTPDTAARSLLMPHQAKLVSEFLSPGASKALIIRSPPQFGMGGALTELITRVIQGDPSGNALLITPVVVLREQFRRRIEALGTPVLSLDRPMFRELLDVSPGTVAWPKGTVVCTTLAFARLPDIRDALARVRWRVVVVDEAHQASGPESSAAVAAITRNAERLVFASLPGIALPALDTLDEVRRVEWMRTDLIDAAGRPLAVAAPPIVEEVRYDLSTDELTILDSVADLISAIDVTPMASLRALSLANAAIASPAVLEGSLRMLLGPNLPGRLSSRSGSTEHEWSTPIPEAAAALIGDLIESVEDLAEDSKLAAAKKLIHRLHGYGARERRAFIITKHVSSARYVGSQFESDGLSVRVVDSAMDRTARNEAAHGIVADVVVMTMAAVQGQELHRFTDVIVYDVPTDPHELKILLSGFDDPTRRQPIHVHLLTVGGGRRHRMCEIAMKASGGVGTDDPG
jgi:hypothetical protein